MSIPPRLETIEPDTLDYCQSLCRLAFDTPSRLREIHLPQGNFGVLKIPDAVEVLMVLVPGPGSQSRLIQLGRESHLPEIHLM
jgi:hypothetical protein